MRTKTTKSITMSLFIFTMMLMIAPVNTQAAVKTKTLKHLGTYTYDTRKKTATLKTAWIDKGFVYMPYGISIGRKTYKVTRISKNVFKGYENTVEFIESDSPFTTIEANTFNLPNANSIEFSNLPHTVKFKKNAFRKINKRCEFSVATRKIKNRLRKYNRNIRNRNINVVGK